MKKVLIVDDEENIRDGMKYLIDWQNYDYEIIATAKNGQEGLEKIRSCHPDLVITDIQMPILNGLDMIQVAYEENLTFQAIILSGYSEFEYAQKAIQLGFVSYLLKPIDEEELVTILEKINLQDQESNEILLKESLYAKLFGNDLSGLNEFTYILACRLKEKDAEILMSLIEKWTEKNVLLYMGTYVYLIILTNTLVFKLDIEEVLSKQNYELLISTWHPTSKSLQTVANEIKRLNELTFLFPNQVLFYKNFQKSAINVEVHEKILNSLVDAVLKGRQLEELSDSYQNFLRKTLQPAPIIREIVENDYRNVMTNTLECIQFQGSRKELSQADFHEVSSFEELTAMFNLKINQLKEVVQSYSPNFDIIEEICRYLDQNYYEDLNLKTIADKFGYNSAYLGKKFKKEKQQSFSQYLDKLRLKKAADLLKNTTFLIYEVASKAGYKNVDYFHKKFKQFYHQSPNDYRQKN